MGREYWIDIFCVALVRGMPRRGALRAAGLLGTGFVLNNPIVSTATGAKSKKKKQKSKKNRPKPPLSPPPTPCSNGACAAEPEWTGRPGQIGHCEFICRQCDGHDSREFCIIDGERPDGSATKVAVCCDEGHTCCGGRCCEADDPYTACCDGRCVDTVNNDRHCGTCGNRCAANEVCRFGQCVCYTDCDGCPSEGDTWCGDRCVDTMNDPEHCGGCFAPPCRDGETCVNGDCVCLDFMCPQGKRCINSSTNQYCNGQTAGNDCQCGCGNYNYCLHPELGWVCFSGDCSLIS
jgi:hypothetical protein